MMNDIKLKNGIAFNIQNNEITGFIREQLNKKDMFENILNINKKSKYLKLPSEDEGII